MQGRYLDSRLVYACILSGATPLGRAAVNALRGATKRTPMDMANAQDGLKAKSLTCKSGMVEAAPVNSGLASSWRQIFVVGAKLSLVEAICDANIVDSIAA